MVTYLAFMRGANSRNNSTTQKQPTKIVFQSCFSNEACVISQKCQDGYVKDSLDDEKINAKPSQFNIPFSRMKKCKEDIFKNIYVCCKIPGSSRPFQATSTASKISTTTYRPLISTSRTTNRFITTTPPSTTTTKGLFYKNNYHLTNTLAPNFSHTDTTQSTLINGVGLRFHSHLHTKSAMELNKSKPNPYSDSEPAIILLEDDPIYGQKILKKTEKFLNNSSNSIELLSAASNFNQINATTNITPKTTTKDFPETTTKIPTTIPHAIERKSTPANINTNSSLTINANVTVLKNSTTTEVKYEKVDVNKIPEVVPLKEEYSTYPPFGFIFKGTDLFIPEYKIPSQNFIPPTLAFGESPYPDEIPGIQSNTEEYPEETTTVYPETEQSLSEQII